MLAAMDSFSFILSRISIQGIANKQAHVQRQNMIGKNYSKILLLSLLSCLVFKFELVW